MTESVKNAIYEGCQVLSPEGELMFRCRRKKAEWYLKKDLASRLSDDPLTIQLSFVPKGPGRVGDPFHLQRRKNVCCVCGETETLSRHHVVPYCYTKYDSDGFRHNSHDVLPMCQDCHTDYEENHSLRLRKKLAHIYEAPISGRGAYSEESRAAKISKAIVEHSFDMSAEKLASLIAILKNYLGHDPLLDEVINLSNIESSKGEYKSHGEMVMSQIDDVNKFVRMWRKHFLKTMEPKHMPEHWDTDRPIYVVDEDGNRVIYRK